MTTREVKNTETGASELYDPQVVLRNGEATWLEPLSGHWFHPAPKFPGKVDWVPPTAKAAAGSLDQNKALMDWQHNMWHVGALTQLDVSWSDCQMLEFNTCQSALFILPFQHALFADLFDAQLDQSWNSLRSLKPEVNASFMELEQGNQYGMEYSGVFATP